jgi:hypothetical protein
MIELPPEFFGLVEALWVTYQPAIWIWLAVMFSGVVLLGIGVVAWSIIRKIT